MKEFYYIDMTFCCVGIKVKDGRISFTPPIFSGWKGKYWEKFYMYYYQKGKIKKVVRIL